MTLGCWAASLNTVCQTQCCKMHALWLFRHDIIKRIVSARPPGRSLVFFWRRVRTMLSTSGRVVVVFLPPRIVSSKQQQQQA